MERLLRISNRIDRFVSGIGRLAAWLAAALMAVIIFDVVTRRFLVLGSTKLQEMEWHIHGVLFLLCLGFAYLRDAHVRIELVRDGFSPRTKAVVELLGCLFFLIPYAVVVIWFDIEFARRAFATGEVSAALTGLGQRWIIKSVIGVGFGLLILAAIAVSIKCVSCLIGHDRDDGGGPAPDPRV